MKLFKFVSGFLVLTVFTACSSSEMRKEEQTQKNPDIVLMRTINASRDRVWKTWTKPEQIKKWWGPRGFSAPVVKNDLRSDGKYLYAMKEDSSGKLFWSTGTYKEIEPFKKIVATDSFSNEKGEVVPGDAYGMPGLPLELMVMVTFEEVGPSQTKLTVRHSGFPPGETAKMAEMGWNESLDKFEAVATGKALR